jgi:hypothetical protein
MITDYIERFGDCTIVEKDNAFTVLVECKDGDWQQMVTHAGRVGYDMQLLSQTDVEISIVLSDKEIRLRDLPRSMERIKLYREARALRLVVRR